MSADPWAMPCASGVSLLALGCQTCSELALTRPKAVRSCASHVQLSEQADIMISS